MEIAYLACEARRPQPVLIRVTPGIDIGGHPAVVTGVDDQKFGFALTDGCAIAAAQRILHQPPLELVGLHCHIGSQVADPTRYGEVDPPDDRRDGRHPRRARDHPAPSSTSVADMGALRPATPN